MSDLINNLIFLILEEVKQINHKKNVIVILF